MTETIRTISELLSKQCQPSLAMSTEALADWYKKASTIYLQTEILYKDLSSFEDDVSAFSLGLRHSQDRYLQLVRDLAARVREAREEAVPPPAPTPQPPCDTRNMRKAVKSILSTQVFFKLIMILNFVKLNAVKYYVTMFIYMPSEHFIARIFHLA